MFWQPMVQTLTRNIWKTRSLLTIIPLNHIETLKGVRLYLRYLFDQATN